MRKFLLFIGFTALAAAGPVSFTGSLATPEDTFIQSFTVSVPADVDIVSYGFGGGMNAMGSTIPAGGFDPLVAVFTGAGAIVTDGLGNPAADADNLLGFTGNCPPAGTVTIGTGTGNVVCGDPALHISNLAPGTYALFVSDANYVPFAVNPGPPASSMLSDGFNDLTGGVSQTCNLTSDGTFCITPTRNYAVDLIVSGATSPSVPEPGSGGFVLAGIAALAGCARRQRVERNY